MGKNYVVYGARWCEYCCMAIELLESRSLNYFFADLSDKEDFLKEVKSYYESPTIPIILSYDASGGKVTKLGGFSDLKESLESD